AFTADGKRFFTVHEDGTMREWDRDTGKLSRSYVGHEARSLSIALSPDGHAAAVGSEDGLVTVWDLDTGDRRFVIRAYDPPRSRAHHAYAFSEPAPEGQVIGIVYTPDGNAFVTTAGGVSPARFWNASSGALRDDLGLDNAGQHPTGIGAVAFSPDNKLIAIGASKLRLLDRNTGDVLQTIGQGDWDAVTSVVFSRSGALFAAVLGGGARVFDTATGKELDHAGSSGSRAVVSTDDRLVAIWDGGLPKNRGGGAIGIGGLGGR